MASVSKQQDFLGNNFDPLMLSGLFQQSEMGKRDDSSKALLATLSKSLEEILDEINPKGKTGASNKVVPLSFSQPQTTPPLSQVPSDATMQQAMGKLIGVLSQLETEIAKWGNKKSELNVDIGNDYMKEMEAQTVQAKKDLEEIAKAQDKSDTWSKFTKIAEITAGVLVCAIAILCGQPELAAIMIVMTVLSASGGMDKGEKILSDSLQKSGLSPEAANVLAAAIIVVASIAITMATCGAGAAGAAEAATDAGLETEENGVEMTDMGTNAAQTTTQTTTQAAEESQTLLQRVQNFFGKVGETIKNNNPFSKLSKPVNMGIIAGSMAVGSTNFGQYFATAALSHMKDGDKKQGLQIAIEVVIELMAALAGIGAGTAAASSGTADASFQLKNSSTVSLALKGLLGMQFVAGIGEASGQLGSASADFELANATQSMGITQAMLDYLRSLTGMNNSQAQSDSKALNGELRNKSESIATLSTDVVKSSAAVANVLRQ